MSEGWGYIIPSSMKYIYQVDKIILEQLLELCPNKHPLHTTSITLSTITYYHPNNPQSFSESLSEVYLVTNK